MSLTKEESRTHLGERGGPPGDTRCIARCETSNGEKPRGLKPAARNTETRNSLAHGRQLLGFLVGRKEVVRVTGVDRLAHVGREFADLRVVGIAFRPFRELAGEDDKAQEVSQNEALGRVART